MNTELGTRHGDSLLNLLKPLLVTALAHVNELHFTDADVAMRGPRQQIAAARSAYEDASDEHLADIFVLGSLMDFIAAYRALWEAIIQRRFSASWIDLQNALDYLRLIKRFSNIDIAFFESQLVEIEKLYPYKLFASISITVERFECSICGADIDSLKCPHKGGYLYMGVMACALARGVTAIDHIALVSDPADKRCVMSIADDSEQFRLVDYLRTLTSADRCRPLEFSHLRYSKRRRLNPDFIQCGRNDQCFCGSGKKFKKCCHSKRYLENDHVDIVVRPCRAEGALAYPRILGLQLTN